LSGFGVSDIYAILVAQYPSTPFAERAAALRAALTGDEPTPTDTVAAVPAPTTTPGVRPGAAAVGLIGDAAIDPAAGGFTWRVARVPTGLGARALLRNFQRRGFRTGATVDVGEDGTPIYSVVVGQFGTIEDAEQARSDLPVTGLGSELELTPVDGLVLLTEEQLLIEPPTAQPSAD
jgi:hypothetical protein